MPNPDVAPTVPLTGGERRRQFTASLPMRTALLAVAAVWFLGAVWSYTEQSAFAANKGFAFPHLLPLVIDGFAIAMAGVAWAASLDARPAVAARLATVVAVCASSASNGAWAWIRSNRDLVAVLLGVAVPIAANLAFEVLLAELRRQVQRRRGLPPPVAVPYPRLIRFVLAPWRTFVEWRALVLDLTGMEHAVPRPVPAPPAPAPAGPAPTGPAPRHVTPPAAAVPAAAEVAVAAAAVPAGYVPAAPPEARPMPAEPVAAELQPAAVPDPANEAVGSSNGGRRNGSGTNRSTSTIGTSTNGTPRGTGTGPSGGADRRSPDSRVEMLAAHLAATEDAGEFTGEMVGPLLGIEVAPRTGRRLLGQARELVAERARAEAERHDNGLRVIGAG